jgi:uncharacterized protein (TIGR02118 family)
MMAQDALRDTDFCLFLEFSHRGDVVPEAELAALARLCATTPGLARALLHSPGSTSDPYLHDGPSPALAIQLYFTDIAALEAATGQTGHLQEMPCVLPSLAGAEATQQAMLVRHFPVPDARFRTAAGQPHATYLVAYQGVAEDMNAWLSYYIAHHPPIMAKFPGIRQIEICSRLDWCGFLPYRRVDHMQRNKVVFDDAAALTAALNSDVRHEMRRDFANFPKFSGANTHFPTHTRVAAG